MACRFKHWIYLACLVLVVIGALYSYSRSSTGWEVSEPWPWDDNLADTSRDLLNKDLSEQDDEYYDEPSDSDGNMGFDESDDHLDMDFDDIHNGLAVDHKQNRLHDEQVAGASDSDFQILYNEDLIDLRTDDGENDISDRQMSNLLNKLHAPTMNELSSDLDVTTAKIILNDADQLPPGIPQGLNVDISENVLPNLHEQPQIALHELPEDDTYQILSSHIDQIQPPQPVQMPQSVQNQDQPHMEVVEKYKPRIVFRSTESRDPRDVMSEQPKIPKIIHQSWETTNIPINFVPWIQSWLQKNSGWEYWFWTNEDVRTLIQTSYSYFGPLYDSPSLTVMDRANVMRYFIIHAHGGVYAELDMECLNSMDSWIFSHDCFLAEEAREHSYLVHNKKEGNVINAIMACKPHHPFFDVVTKALPEYLTRHRGQPSKASGSFFLDEVYHVFKRHPLPAGLAHYGDVVMIEPDYFIPSYDERYWTDINTACNTNILDMPFHVSWLCTLWLRKRTQDNQPYKHSYTDHHWVDISELVDGNVATVPITSILDDVLFKENQNPDQVAVNQEYTAPGGMIYPVFPLSPQLPIQSPAQETYGETNQVLPLIDPENLSPVIAEVEPQKPSYTLPDIIGTYDKVPDTHTESIHIDQGLQQVRTDDFKHLSLIPQQDTQEPQVQLNIPQIPPLPLENQQYAELPSDDIKSPDLQSPIFDIASHNEASVPVLGSITDPHHKSEANNILTNALTNFKAHSTNTEEENRLYSILKTAANSAASQNLPASEPVSSDNLIGAPHNLFQALPQYGVAHQGDAISPLGPHNPYGVHNDIATVQDPFELPLNINNNAKEDIYNKAYPKQDQYAIPNQDSYAVPNQDSYAVPNQDSYAVLNQDSYAVPNQYSYAVPKQEPYDVLNQDSYAVPNQDSYAVPNQDRYDVPKQEPYAVPNQDSHAVLNQDSYAVPNQDSQAVLNQDSYAVPKQEPYAVPKQEPYAVLNQDSQAVPNQHSYVVPKQDSYVVPKQEPYDVPKQEPYDVPKQEPYAVLADSYVVPKQEPYAASNQDPYAVPKEDIYIPKIDSYQVPQNVNDGY